MTDTQRAARRLRAGADELERRELEADEADLRARADELHEWLYEEEIVVETGPKGPYPDPEKLTAEERLEREALQDEIAAEIDAAATGRPEGFLDPYAGGKAEMGTGGAAAYAEKLRKSLGVEDGRPPKTIGLLNTPRSLEHGHSEKTSD